MQVGFKSDKGLRRSNNEDACFVLLPDKVYVVADGVGGGNAGEIASRTAVSEIANYILEHPIANTTNKYAVVNYLQSCLDEANSKIFRMANTYEENTGMATTVVIAYVAFGKVFITNVGDSRAYRLRNGEFLQISHDHVETRSLAVGRKAPLTQHLGINPEDMLIEPGHIIPTPKPQSAQPASPRIGIAERDASK